MTLVGKSTRSQFYDEHGQVREGVVVVKLVKSFGPYGYQVRYHRAIDGGEGHHEWTYLGKSESGLPTGSYAPGTALKFYLGRQKKIEDRKLNLVGNWDKFRFDAELDDRLQNTGFLDVDLTKEVLV